jgi:CRP-like cAMP-binding protein
MDAERLRSIPLFEGLSRKELDQVGRWADELDVAAGRDLLDQGRLPHEFFVIEEGTVEVRQDRRPIATLGPGDFFGEIALIEGDRRTATVETTTPVRAIVMDSRSFGAMMDALPKVADRIREAGRRRLGND